MASPAIHKGVIRGRIIELDAEPGFPDGQSVNVAVEAVAPATTSEDSLKALKDAAGSWTDDVEGLDRFLEWNRQQRKGPRREIPE